MEPAQETRTKNQFTLISRRKVQSAKILGKDEQGLGARYDYFFFCFPFRNRGNQGSMAERTKKLLCQRVNGYE